MFVKMLTMPWAVSTPWIARITAMFGFWSAIVLCGQHSLAAAVVEQYNDLHWQLLPEIFIKKESEDQLRSKGKKRESN